MSQTVLPQPALQPRTTVKDWVVAHQLIAFFVLTYAIAYGSLYASLWFDLPFFGVIWFLNTFSPTIAALILSAVCGGMPAVKQLLLGYTRWKVGWQWYLGALSMLLIPLCVALVYQALGGEARGLAAGATAVSMLGQFIFTFFSGPFAEEAGWRGFALPRLQARYNALVSSLVLGVIWTFWHLPLWFHPETNNRIPFLPFLLLTVTLTTFMTWLYNNTRGSLVITILTHFSYNLVGGFVTGTLGMMPMNTFLMFAVPGLALLFAWVLIFFGPKYLSRKPVSELPFPARE
jgi:membrane protease YdiL (CAAX protease family)